MGRHRLVVATIGYICTLVGIVLAMITGYHGQVARRLNERTREVAVAH
jgi:ABC-type dipeptide/oligopeptide/nickel transport system permease subunit